MADEVVTAVEETNDSAGQTSLRSTLEGAFEAAEAPDSSDHKETSAAPVQTETSVPDPEQVGVPVRDEKGRFAPKTAAETAQEAQGQPKNGAIGQTQLPTSTTPQGAPGRFDKAPPDWGPKGREAWGKVPPEAREEAYNQFINARKALSYAENVRKQAAEPLQNVVSIAQGNPHAFNGRDVFATLGRLASISNTLESPSTPMPVKASMIAEWLDGFGIPEQLLAAAIDARRGGKPLPGVQGWGPGNTTVSNAPQQQFRDPRVDDLFRTLQQQHQQAVVQEHQAAQGEVAEFSQGKEFFNDVRHLMADIVDLKHARKEKYTLDEVYQLACNMSPEVQGVMRQREQVSRTSPAAVGRARVAAGATLRSSGVAPQAASDDNSVRALLEQQFNGR